MTVASVCTVATILSPGVLGILMCISLWGAVPVLLQVARLQRRFPGMITREKLMRRERRGLSAEAEARLEERAAQRRAAVVRSYSVVAGVLLIGVVTILVASSLEGDDGAVQAGPRGAELSAEEVARRDGKVIKTEVVTGRPLRGWGEYADLLFLAAMATAEDDGAEAERLFAAGAKM